LTDVVNFIIKQLTNVVNIFRKSFDFIYIQANFTFSLHFHIQLELICILYTHSKVILPLLIQNMVLLPAAPVKAKVCILICQKRIKKFRVICFR